MQKDLLLWGQYETGMVDWQWLTKLSRNTQIIRNRLRTASRQNRRNQAAETGSQLRQVVEIKRFWGKSDNRIDSDLRLLRENEITTGHPLLQPLALVTGNIHIHRINFHSQFSKEIFLTVKTLKPQAILSRTTLVCCVPALKNLMLLCIWPHTQRNHFVIWTPYQKGKRGRGSGGGGGKTC